MNKVLLLPNETKPEVREVLPELRTWLGERCETLVERTTLTDSSGLDEDALPEADLAIVLGGDGTLLSQARRIAPNGTPVIGVNFGKLGFLAEFTLDELKEHWAAINDHTCHISERVLLEAAVYSSLEADEPFHRSLAMNDVVITAGRPFRMIGLELVINPDRNGQTGTEFRGDGVIVSTPTGSTAYNLSAGGPIIAPDVGALVITPICAHSLSFRSIIVGDSDRVRLLLHEANPGTTLVIDGQTSTPLSQGTRIELGAYPNRLNIVRHPSRGYWKTLARKMHWASRPTQDLK